MTRTPQQATQLLLVLVRRRQRQQVSSPVCPRAPSRIPQGPLREGRGWGRQLAPALQGGSGAGRERRRLPASARPGTRTGWPQIERDLGGTTSHVEPASATSVPHLHTHPHTRAHTRTGCTGMFLTPPSPTLNPDLGLASDSGPPMALNPNLWCFVIRGFNAHRKQPARWLRMTCRPMPGSREEVKVLRAKRGDRGAREAAGKAQRRSQDSRLSPLTRIISQDRDL